jgi:hypothetical protein
VDRYTGKTHPITTRDSDDSHSARVKSYLDVLEEYATHADPKSADSAGKPCGRDTTRLIYRRMVGAGSIYCVGKESNFVEDLEYDLIHDPDEIQQKYFDPAEDRFQSLRFTMKRFPNREIARRTDRARAMSERCETDTKARHRRRRSQSCVRLRAGLETKSG